MIDDIVDELKNLLKAQTLDAMIPVLLFSLLNGRLSLEMALFIALTSSVLISLFRVLKQQKYQYAVLGTLFLFLASLLSYYSQNASNFYLPNIITHAFILFASLLSLILKKPLSIYVSHITRAWTLDWYYRADIFPAYHKVTLLWIFLFTLSVLVQSYVYLYLDVSLMAWMSQLFSLPYTLVVLIATYVYGLHELKKLKGPGIDEYLSNKSAPFRGQTRGF